MLEKLVNRAKKGLVIGAAVASMAFAGTAMGQVRSGSNRVGSDKDAKVEITSISRKPSGRSSPTDPHATLIALPEYTDGAYKTQIEVMNGTINRLDLTLLGREGRLGFDRDDVDLEIFSRGTYKNMSESLFDSRSVDKFDISVLREDYDPATLFGKLTTTLRITSPLESTQSAFSFNSARGPASVLSFPYRPLDASFCEAVLSNEGSTGVDVYLRKPNGEEVLVANNLGVHRQVKVHDFADLFSGDFVAYRPGTFVPLDSLVGTMKFRYDDDYRRAEGYTLRDSSSFSSEFYMPLHIVEDMTELERSTDGWEKFMYHNKTDSDQILVVRHFNPDGHQMMIGDFDSGDFDSVALEVSAHGRVAKMPQTLGVARNLGGTLQMSVRDSDGLEDPLAVGDMVYLVGDMPDDIMGSSILAGGLAPSSNDMSKYLRFGLSTFGDTREVFAIHNPHDVDAVLDFAAFSPLGSGTPHNLPTNVTIPAHGTVVYNSQDALGLGFKGSSLLGADHGLVGVVLDYSVTPVKDQLSTSGVIMESVNEPRGDYALEDIQFNGVVNPTSFNTTMDRTTSIIIDFMKHVGTYGVNRIEFYVDNILHDTVSTNDTQGGQINTNINFTELGKHTVDIKLYAADDNIIEDDIRHLDVNVLESAIMAQLQYFDIDHNPTDTLKVNEPFYVQYNVERFDGDDISKLLLWLTPHNGSGEPEDITITGLSGTSASGEVYVAEGIAINSQDGLNNQYITPGMIVWNSNNQSETFDSQDSEYNLPAERVYDDIADYYQLTESNVETLAEILSRNGVLIGGTTQLDYDSALGGLQNLLASGIFAGITINDYQNTFYTHYNDGTPSRLFTLGDQTYFAEQNTDDLKVVYQLN